MVQSSREVVNDDLLKQLQGTREIVFKNKIRDLKYDSISGKLLVVLEKKKNEAGKTVKVNVDDNYPYEYKRWFPVNSKIEKGSIICIINAESLKEDQHTENTSQSRHQNSPDLAFLFPGKLICYYTGWSLYQSGELTEVTDLKSGITEFSNWDRAVVGLFPEMDLLISIDKKGNIYGSSQSSGKDRWDFSLKNPDKGWNDLIRINDSTLLFSVSGLYFLNTSTGQTLHLPFSSSDDISSVNDPLIEKAGIKDLIWFRYHFDDGRYSSAAVWGLASNLVYDKHFVYSAGRNDVICTDHNGVIIWQNTTDTMAAGRLILCDSLLVHINKGYAIRPEFVKTYAGSGYFISSYVNYMKTKCLYNIPGITAVNRYNGKPVYKHKLSNDHDVILDIRYIPGNDTLQLITRYKIILTSILSGDNIAVKQFCEPGNADMSKIPPENTWLMNNAGVFFSTGSNFTHPAIMIDYNRLWLFDNQLNNEKIYYSKDIWYFAGSYNGKTIISNKTGAIILSPGGVELLKIPGTGSSCVAGSKLFVADGNSIKVLEIGNIQE